MNLPSSLDNRDPMELQFNLLVEELVRERLGCVRHESYQLSHRSKSIKALCGILKSLSEDNYRVLMDDTECIDEIYLFSPQTVVRCTPQFKTTSTIDYLIFHVYTVQPTSSFRGILQRKGFRKYSPSKPTPDTQTEITYAFPGRGGPVYKERYFDNLSLKSIACNYTSDVVDKVRALIKYTYEAKHGLVVISGPVGTGKSYLIRSILTEINKDRMAVVCNPATTFLEDVNLLNTVASNFERSFLVFEDIGDVLTLTASSRHLDVKSNLLNMSEGFLSLLMDTIILVSFNHELDRIDPAVTRPGRCLASIDVGLLPYKQASTLIPFSIPERQYSLAEIYELRRLEDLKKGGS